METHDKKNDLSKEDLISLLEHNSDKMNFQQSQCFQIKNWAMVIVLGVLTILWSRDLSLWINITLHAALIICLLYFFRQDREWGYFFIAFKERVKYIENIIISNESTDNFENKYYELIPKGSNFVDKQIINMDYFYFLP